MSINPATDQDIEFNLWEEMKKYEINKLHEELISQNEARCWAAAREIQVRGKLESYRYVVSITSGGTAATRQVAAFVLGQLGTPNRPFLKESLSVLLGMLSDDQPCVRAEAVVALGHLGSAQVFEDLVRFAQDKSDWVREGVAFALGKINDKRAVGPLLKLTYDKNRDVMIDALISLRRLRIQSSIVLDRYVELLSDPRQDIRNESICGLADFGDKRAVKALLEALDQPEIFFELLEAAGNLGDINALPRLKALSMEWKDDPPKVLKDAIKKIETKAAKPVD